MKIRTRLLSVILALILGLSACGAGFAEEKAVLPDTKTLTAFFSLMFSMIPGTKPIDWEAFNMEYEKKVASGAELTLEDCLPAEAWKVFSLLMRMEEDASLQSEESLPFTDEMTVKGNHVMAVHQLKEQTDEETAKKIDEVMIQADFEGTLSLGYLKSYLDLFGDAGVNLDNITLSMQYLNADGTVIRENTYTFADLEAAVKPAA